VTASIFLTISSVKPVVVTGAMRSSSELGYDGPSNLSGAVCTAISDSARNKGVLIVLNNEVIYANTPMPEALKYISYKVDSPIRDILVKVSEKLLLGESNSIYESFKEEYKNMSSDFRLNKEDLRVIKDFLKSLGESGVYGQDKLFNLTIENLKINCGSAEEIAKKNVKMYRSLGICIGAMIVIFLI